MSQRFGSENGAAAEADQRNKERKRDTKQPIMEREKNQQKCLFLNLKNTAEASEAHQRYKEQIEI